jgi:hypothetical protein
MELTQRPVVRRFGVRRKYISPFARALHDGDERPPS